MNVTWNLRMLCAQKGIWRAAELGRRLNHKLGLELSATTLTSLMVKTPKNLSMNLLLALCVALDCTPNDLIVVDASYSRRTAEHLVASITKVNAVRAPRNPRPGRRRKRVPVPPTTRI